MSDLTSWKAVWAEKNFQNVHCSLRAQPLKIPDRIHSLWPYSLQSAVSFPRFPVQILNSNCLLLQVTVKGIYFQIFTSKTWNLICWKLWLKAVPGTKSSKVQEVLGQSSLRRILPLMLLSGKTFIWLFQIPTFLF